VISVRKNLNQLIKYYNFEYRGNLTTDVKKSIIYKYYTVTIVYDYIDRQIPSKSSLPINWFGKCKFLQKLFLPTITFLL